MQEAAALPVLWLRLLSQHHFKVLHARSLHILSPLSTVLLRTCSHCSFREGSCRSTLLFLVIVSLYSNQWSLLPGDCGIDCGLLDRAPDFLTELLPCRQ